MRQGRRRAGLVGIALFVVFLIAPPALARGVAVEAVIDRVEDGGWLVLDLPPHPSLPVPARIAPALGEGDAVTVVVEQDARGAWTVIADGPAGLRLSDAHGSFHWPASLAPAVRRGDRLAFALAPDRARAEALAAEIREIRERLTKR